MKDEKAVLIWAEDGCWFQTVRDRVVRSSYLGRVGPTKTVEAWCRSRGIEFVFRQAPLFRPGRTHNR